MALWLHNPHITRLEERESGVHVLEMHYPLIHHSNQRPYHFLHGYAQFLEQQLGVRVPVTRFHGDVYLADEESVRPCRRVGPTERFGSSWPAANTTSRLSGGIRRATKRSSTTFGTRSTSCNAAKPGTGIRRCRA